MAKTAEQLLQTTIGGMVLQIHQLQSQMEAAKEIVAAKEAEIQSLKVRNAELESKTKKEE